MNSAESPRQTESQPPTIRPPAGDSAPIAYNWRWIGVGVLVFAVLMYPIFRRAESGTTAPISSPAANTLPDLLTLSLQYYQARRYAEAVAVSKAVIEMNPRSVEAYNNLGVSYAGLHQYPQAVASLGAALRLNPDYQLARNNLSWITMEMRKNMPAQPSGERTADDYLNQSAAEYKANHFEAALASARQCLRLRPDDAEAYSNMAASYIRLRRYDEAVQAAQNAVRIRPDFMLAGNNLAWALEERKKASGRGARSQ
jgi:tetratricopeptide (TPR) repeat protein